MIDTELHKKCTSGIEYGSIVAQYADYDKEYRGIGEGKIFLPKELAICH
jgi:hypothetical protein